MIQKDVDMSFGTNFSGTACTLPTSGTEPDCLGGIGGNGSLIIQADRIQVTAEGRIFDQTRVNASIGRTILSLPVGSSIDLQNIDQIYADLNVNLWKIGDDVSYGLAAAQAEWPGGDVFIAPVIVTAEGNVNPCFARGTRILTIDGEIAVEDLYIGDIVVNMHGDEREIIWIGHSDIDFASHPNRPAVLPVIIEAGALGENCPSRCLTLLPNHALFIDGVLVRPKDLLNGITIRQSTACPRLRYYYVELACHDILFAEGAAAESYLDTGHRGVFANAEAPVVLHPDFKQVRRAAESCAPLCTGGDMLERIRTRLAHGMRSHADAALACA
jgi:hypothetical protein